MANEQHAERAGYAVGNWNRWRESHPDVAPDLSGADLSSGMHAKRNLSGADLSGADFRRSNMRGCDLHGSNLVGADLSKTDLRGADLREADLTRADLSKASLDEADLTGARLEGALLAKADLAATTGLTQAQLDEAEGDGSTTELPPGLARPERWGAAQSGG